MALIPPSSRHSLKSEDFEGEEFVMPNGSIGKSNGIEDESPCDESLTDNFNMIPSSKIKSEPSDYIENDLDSQNARFNLRKRKASFTSVESSNGIKETEVPREDGVKKRKKFVYTYTPNQMQEALDLVHSENISILTAAKQYGIPRSTLRRYALTVWAAAAPKSRSKQEPALTPPEEAHIVSMITKMSRSGKYVSTMDVKSTVQNLLDEGHRMVFKDRNRPTAGWVQRFRKRHKDLPLKGSGYTVKKPSPASQQDVKEWYDEVSDYLLKEWELDPADFFTDKNMHRIYNLDEMSLSLNCKQDLAEESLGSPHKNEDILNEVTVLTAVSAAGECMQPLIVQKGEGGGHDDDIMPLDQNSYGISFSIAGKLNYEIFMRWLEAFDRELSEKDIPKPIIIFLDDVFAHFQISVFTYAIDNDIILLCLQSPNLQPIYAELSEQVRSSYKEYCKEHYRLSGSPISMDLFPETFLKAWETVKDEPGMKERLKDSFRHFGLSPFTPNATAFVDLPEVLEEPPKSEKYYKSTKLHKEPKAKKTVPSKVGNEMLMSSTTLLPTVKIQKLEKQTPLNCYKNVEGLENSSLNGLNEVSSQSPQETKKLKQILKARPSKIPSTVQTNLGQHVPNDRILGRQDGIRKCLDLMESFIPSDIIAVWRNRGGELQNSSEIPYCMWKTVNNLLRDLTSQSERNTKTLKMTTAINSVKVNSLKKKIKDDFINPMDYLQCESYDM